MGSTVFARASRSSKYPDAIRPSAPIARSSTTLPGSTRSWSGSMTVMRRLPGAAMPAPLIVRAPTPAFAPALVDLNMIIPPNFEERFWDGVMRVS